MASLTIRNIPDDAKLRFRQVAAAHGRSMEEHLRQLILSACNQETPLHQGVNDVSHSFRHFEPEPIASTGSSVIDELIRLANGAGEGVFDKETTELREFDL